MIKMSKGSGVKLEKLEYTIKENSKVVTQIKSHHNRGGETLENMVKTEQERNAMIIEEIVNTQIANTMEKIQEK